MKFRRRRTRIRYGTVLENSTMEPRSSSKIQEVKEKITCGQISWYVLWLCGFYCTFRAIYTNYWQFLKYDSILNVRQYDQYESKVRNISTTFPVIIACANSPHSLSKGWA